MTQSIHLGIIGLGAIGERLIPSFVEHPNVQIKAICDTNTQHMENIKSKYDLPAKTYTMFSELLEDQEVNSIYIAVPPKWHHTYTMQAFEKGMHILCEKPLANSLKEAEEMVQAANNSNTVNAIHFPLHYSKEVELLKSKLHDIGNIQRIELTMRFELWPRSWQQNDWIAKREQGGFIREITPHFIQLTHSLLGPITDLTSQVLYPSNDSLCETSIIASGKLSNGVPILFNGISGIGQKDDLTYRIYGDKGVLSLDQWAQLKQGSPESPLELIQSREESAVKSILDEFVKAVNKEPSNLVSFQQGLLVQEVLEALL